MYECFHCLNKSVCWDCDYDFEDFDYDGEGIVHMLHCRHCGAEIEYRVPTTEEDINELEEYNVPTSEIEL
jgi:transcription elongation factor Elf1